MIIIVLDRSNDEIHVAVLHIHPCKITCKVVICAECLYTLDKVFAHTLVLCKLDCLLHKGAHLVKFLLVLLTIPYCLEGTVLITTDDSVEIEFVRILKCIPFLHGHILRIVLATKWLLTISSNKRIVVVEVIPRTVVDHCICSLIFVGEGIHFSLVSECLFPEKTVHDISCLTEKSNDLLIVLRKSIVKR